MTNNLYEISQAYVNSLNDFTVDDETGEIIFNQEAIDQLEDSLKNKADNIACFIKDLTALNDSIKAEKTALDERMKANDKKIESLKRYLTNAMQLAEMDKLETSRNMISFRKSKSVIIGDEAMVPDQYIKTVLTSKVDKKAIGDALKAGTTVPGCYLEEKKNIQIK